VNKEAKGKININANPSGILEIEEFKNRLARNSRGRRLKVKLKKNT